MKKVCFSTAMIFMVLALMVTGCAKKAAEPTAEVTPPAQAAPAAPGQEMKPEGGAAAGGAVAAVSGESVAFEKRIYFDFDMFNLSSDAIGTLNELAAVLKANGDYKARIEGNCDERGTNEYNLALGERRAKAAYDYLVSLGIDEARLSTVSYGEEKPVDPGNDEEAWAKNRRDDFVLSK